MPNPDDLLITGFGVVSPIGIGNASFWDSIKNQRNHVTLLNPVGGDGKSAWLYSGIDNFNAKEHIHPRKIVKVMCIETQITFAASMLACQQAKIESGTIDSDRLGTVFASEIIFSENDDILSIVRLCQENNVMKHSEWGANAIGNMYPLWMLKSLPNMPACHVGISIDARGPNNTITSEDTSSLSAIIEACQVIRRGQADCMVVGSTGGRINQTRLIQRIESHYSKSFEDPAKACKPYDRRRDGTFASIGSGSIVIERRSTAEARGVKGIATIKGWSSTFETPTSHWNGNTNAVSRSLEQALVRSNLKPSDIDHVNGSAKGAIDLDSNEGLAIRKVLGDVPVTSLKGYLGDSGASSGLLELCGSLAGIEDRLVPATLNYDQPSADCPIHVISGQHKPWNKPSFLKTTINPYGQAASVAITVE